MQQWGDNLTRSHKCDVNQRFTGPELNVQRDTVAEHPQNVGFILSNSSTHVNRRDGFGYNLTVGLRSTSHTRWNNDDCKAKRDSVHSLVLTGMEAKLRAKMLYPQHKHGTHSSGVRPANSSQMRKATVHSVTYANDRYNGNCVTTRSSSALSSWKRN